MQFVFNQHWSPKSGCRSFRWWCVCSFVVTFVPTIVVGTANGQGRFGGQRPPFFQRQSEFQHQSEFSQPRNFGDTPSPTEMMARLKFHKQQETPLFDLLRESGLDIFAKLSDDEKKLAGRFVEDMILKEGMDSDKVSSLMEQMKISPDAKQALQQGIERAGGDESTISPEQRRELADKIRQQFLQRSNPESDAFKSPSNRNGIQPENSPNTSNPNPNRRYAETERQSAPHAQVQPSDPEVANPDANLTASQRLALEEAARNRGRQQQPEQNDAGNWNAEQLNALRDQLQKDRTERNQAQREQARNNPRPSDTPRGQNRRGFDRSSSPPQSPLPNNKQLSELAKRVITKRAFDQIEDQLNDPQRKVISDIKDKIQNGNIPPNEIGELINDLQSAQSRQQFAERLGDAGQKLGLTDETQEEIQKSLSQLSRDDQQSLQQSFNSLDQDLLANLRSNDASGQPRSGSTDSRSPNPSEQFSPLPDSQPGNSLGSAGSLGSTEENSNNSRVEQLGKDFLKDALDTYNDPDSGYQLSPAFKRLKDQAEGRGSDRELANLGNISQKLFENSAGIFDPNSSTSNARQPGVKPGQRFDQLIAEAAGKALADSSVTGDDQNKSFFSKSLSSVLEAALGQVVELADDELPNRDVPDDWDQWSQDNAQNDFDFQDQHNSLQENAGSPYSNNFQDSQSNSSPRTTSSSNNTSIQESASSLAESVSNMKFDGRFLLYALGTFILFGIGFFLLRRLMSSTNENIVKQRELQRKLETNSANPEDVVEAVDLFLLSRFGTDSSWWNSSHASDQLTANQPDWREKIASLFQVYRWSRYQADGDANISSEQTQLVSSTLQELNQAPEESFALTGTGPAQATANETFDQNNGAGGEATS